MISMWKRDRPRICVIFSLSIYMEYTPPFQQKPSKRTIVPYIRSHFPYTQLSHKCWNNPHVLLFVRIFMLQPNFHVLKYKLRSSFNACVFPEKRKGQLSPSPCLPYIFRRSYLSPPVCAQTLLICILLRRTPLHVETLTVIRMRPRGHFCAF